MIPQFPWRHTRRPYLLATLMVALLSLIALASAAQDPADDKPKAVAPETIFDFGVIPRGTAHQHAFKIENQGDATLQILSFNANCACIVADYPKTIAPGASGEVTVELDSTTIEGAGQGMAVITTNDPDNPQLQFVLKAVSQSHIGYEPSAFRYQDVHRHFDGDGAISSTFFSVDGEDFTITGVESPSKYLDVSYREATDDERIPDRPGKQYRLTAVLAKDAPVGPISGYIKVMFDHPIQHATVLPVSGFMRPVLAATPAEVKLGEFSIGDEPRLVKVHIKHFTVWDVKVEKVEIDLPGVETSIEDSDARGVYYAVFKFTPAVPKGPFSTVARVITNAKADNIVEIPFSGTVVDATD